MKKILTMALVATTAITCTNAQDVSYTIKGKAPQGIDSLYVFYNGQMNEAEAIKSTGGIFEIKGNKPSGTFITVAASRENTLTAVIDAPAITLNLADRKIAGSPLNDKLNAFDQKTAQYDQQMSDLYQQWQKLKTSKAADAKAKQKELEAEIEKIEKLQNKNITDFCKENKGNILPAYLLSSNFYGFSYDELAALCDSTTAYYNHPMMKRPKMQLASLAKRRPGLKYTELSMKDMNGADMKLSQLVGKSKYLLVDFWASWCGPCRMEMPNVKKAYELYHAKGFEVLGVSFDNKAEAWKKAVKDLSLAWPQMSDLQGWKCAAHDAYGVNSIPSNVLLDANGTIVASDLRAEELLKKLGELMK